MTSASTQPIARYDRSWLRGRLASAARGTRDVLLQSAESSGLGRLLGKSAWRTRRLLILCYHGVSQLDEHEWSDLYVSQDHLAHRLELLRKTGATVLEFTDAIDLLYRGELPPRAVCLTFDDGAVDFARRAYPVLREFSVPSLLYLTTWYCDKPLPVFDTVLSYVLWRGRGRQLSIDRVHSRVWIPAQISDPEFTRIHEGLRQHAAAARMGADERNALVREIAVHLGVDFDEILERRLLQLMTRDEIRSLQPGSVDIQLHTHRHRTPLDREEFLEELELNRSAINTFTGQSSSYQHFCYPSGFHRPEYRDWLLAAGIRSATTCDPGLATVTDDPYYLPRVIDTMAMPAATFSAWIDGISSAFHLRRRAEVRARL